MTFRRVLIGIGIVIVLGAVGLFVLDQTIFAPVKVGTGTPVAPTLAVPTAVANLPSTEQAAAATQAGTQPAAPQGGSAATPASSASAQLYRIDASQSEVSYTVNETFFQNNRLNTAIGRTKGIAGDVLIDFSQPANSQIGKIVIDVSQFASDESRRDNFIRRTGLDSAQYPDATFVAKSIDGLPATVAEGDQLSVKISGDLTVKDKTKPVTWNATLKVGNKRLEGSASTQILMSDFGVGPIQIPLLQTEDAVKLNFDFVALLV